MKFTWRHFSLIIMLLMFSITSKATHLMGGEITWACQGNGNYIFTLKLYKDCRDAFQIQYPISIRVHNHPSVSVIPMSVLSITDISPQCNAMLPNPSCLVQGPSALDGSIQEHILTSAPITLSGIPPAQGWIFTYSNCCRNAAISNLNIDATNLPGFTLRAIMYPYNGMNESPCFDSSPEFKERPSAVICNGNAYTYNHNAFDRDKDSLVYAFANALEDIADNVAFTATNPPPIPYPIDQLTGIPTYSVSSPLPGPLQNNSVPATLNTFTGEISLQPFYTGSFVTVVKVSSYRCGSLIAEVFREIQVIITDCGVNNPPIVSAPFVDPISGSPSYSISVQAGQTVNFDLLGSEFDILPIGIPQTMSVMASGGQFGAGFTDALSGCYNPPCATLNPAPNPSVELVNGQPITFNWETTCDHLYINIDEGCYAPQTAYTFVITFQDDFCPAPQFKRATITVIVTAPPLTPSPSLRCLEVLPAGDVKLSWIPSTDPQSVFNSYHIFRANSINGPYTIVDSIFNINQSTYTDITGAGANLGSVFYMIRARSGCGGIVLAPAADTLQTLYVNVTDAGSGQIDIAWNALSNPLLPSTQLPYAIDKQILPAALSAFNTSNTTSISDAMIGCLQTINYQIKISDASGCISKSNIDGGPFSNDQAPDSPFLDSISVQNLGNTVLLGWEPSASTDTRAYYIFQMQNGLVVSVDSVLGINTTSYIASGLNPSNGPITFGVAAIDNCNNLGDTSVFHSSIFLRYDLSTCLNRVDLFWSPYIGWGAQPDSYQIYQQVNAGPMVLVGTSTGNVTAFSISNLLSGGNYSYYVRAIFTGMAASSTSNKIDFNADVQDLPQFAYLRKATVQPDGSVYSKCFIDTASDIISYRVLRADSWNGNYQVISENYLIPNSVYAEYTDVSALSSSQSYSYKYQLIDKCDSASKESNRARTIHLKGIADNGFLNKLEWNTYGDWDVGVDQYNVFRSLNNGQTYSLLVNNQLDTTYRDNVAEIVDTLIEFCYYVQAIEQNGNQYNFRDTSYSNRICILQKPTLYVPTAFVPGNFGGNNEFKPIGLFEKLATEYEFMIFNRWGERIFYTKDPNQAWDGRYQFTLAPSGIYVYRIRFKLPDDSNFDERGAVLLID